VVVYWTRLYGDEQHGRRDMKPVDFAGDNSDGEINENDVAAKSLLLGDYEMT
jgi:hypothetical protein